MFTVAKRTKQIEASRLIQRLLNRSVPSILGLKGECRAESRCNRTMPVILAPVEKNSIVVDQAMYALTKDLNGHGLALVLNQPLKADKIVVGFWREADPAFVLGDVRQNLPFGGGFWQIGIELREVPSHDFPGLNNLACRAVLLVP